MIKSRKRAVRVAAILSPLLFLMVFGYWRFLGSAAMREIVAAILGRTLGARVTIGGHEITRPSKIELSDLEMEFLADGRPSGVRFKARRASAHARRLVGLGPFEQVTLEDPEAHFLNVGPSVAGLTLLQRKRSRPGVEKVEFRNMAVAFESSGRVYRVGGMDLALDFSGGGLRISADLGELQIEGLQSTELERERPEVNFGIEIAESRVVLRRLSVGGRTGWKVEGDVEADLAERPAKIRGELQIRDLKVSTIYTPPPWVMVATPTGGSAAVRRTIRFEGTADDLLVSAETDVPEFIYENSNLGLRTEGTTLKDLRVEKRTSLTELLRGLFRKDKTPEAGPADAAR
jgi:hypothetical protein